MVQRAINKAGSRAPARWLVLALSGLATAGFLGAILANADQGQTSPDPPAVATPAAAIETTSARQILPGTLQSTTTSPVAVPTRSPRLRTRGS